ncbi:MAG: Hsp20/alpha crystallin family protein [Clostridia bacterium]|nr:Hsp20/alpha crystallin family protein [Clostridia bacterium]
MRTYLPSVFNDGLMNVLDEFDQDFFHDFRDMDRALYGKHAQRMMKTDVKEMNDHYDVDIELPGFSKDTIHLELDSGYLTVSADKSLEKNHENTEGRMLRQERYAGSMQRTFYVGEQVTEDDIKASYENGVLHLMIAKKDAVHVTASRQIPITGSSNTQEE